MIVPLLPEVDRAILEIIQENLNLVPKKDVMIQRSDVPPKRSPSIYVWNSGFTASDVSIGGNASDFERPVEEGFDGDGKRVSFQLSNPPLRPVIGVEHPPSRLIREGRDYHLDYAKGTLTFPQPPAKGRKNIMVQYSSGRTAGQVKGLRLKLTYNIDVWTSSVEEHSSLATKLASLLISNQESLASKGVQLRLTRGRDLTAKDGIPDGMFCKRLEYNAEADMFVKIPMRRMEQIPIRMK